MHTKILPFSNKIGSVKAGESYRLIRLEFFFCEFDEKASVELMKHVLRIIKESEFSKLLADCRLRMPISEIHKEWLTNVWVRQAIEFGWRYTAIIESMDVIARDDHKKRVDDHNSMHDMKISMFSDVRSAEDWLLMKG